ncbi:MAG: hypothetical protein ABMA64_07735 [Myxococcota bacterium]
MFLVWSTLARAGQLELDVRAADFDLSAETERSISRLLTRMHATYESWLGVVLPPLLPVHVELVSKEADYRAREAAVMGGLRGHTVGFFVPARSQVVVWRGPGEADMRRTLVHETSHFLLSSAGLGRVPLWLNEGLSEVFETSTLDGNAVWLIPDPNLVRWLGGGNLPAASTLLGWSRQDWDRAAAGSPWGRAEYPYGWAVCAFLLSSEGGRALLGELLASTAVSADPAADALAAVERKYDGGAPALDRTFRAWFAAGPGRIQLPLRNDAGQAGGWVKCADGSLIRPDAGYRCGRWVKGDDGLMRYVED